MPKVNYNLRRTTGTSPTPINAVIRWNSERLVYPSGETILPKLWCSSRGTRNFQRAKETKAFPEFPEFNRRLDLLEHTIKDTFRSFSNTHRREPSPNELREALNKELLGKPDEPRSVADYTERFLLRCSERVQPNGRTMSKATIRKYRSSLKACTEFARATNRSIDFASIDLDFYNAYVYHLTYTKRLRPNTVGVRIKVLKTLLHDALEEGLTTNVAFRSRRFKSPSVATDAIYLNEEELDDMANLDLASTPRLERIRDLFLVGAWTGLRFGDLRLLRKEDIQGGFVVVAMSKTDRHVVVPIHAVVHTILKRYDYDLPAAPSNQKFNKYLKEVADLIPCLQVSRPLTYVKGGERIRSIRRKAELLTTHTARRSFASNMYRRGVPAQSIMAVTGHRTETAFMRYVRLEAHEHAAIVSKFMEQLPLLRVG